MLDSVIKVPFTITDLEVIRLRHDPSDSIGISYRPIMVKRPERCRAVKWLTVEQLPILKFNQYAV